MSIVTRIINTQNPAFRFSVVKAKTKSKRLFLKPKISTHWCFVSEHMKTQLAITEHGVMPYSLWANNKEAEFVFQWEMKNVTLIWRMLHLFNFFGAVAHKNNIHSICAGLTECGRGIQASEVCNTDETLMGFMTSNAPLLQPPEMILWELALKDYRAPSDVV